MKVTIIGTGDLEIISKHTKTSELELKKLLEDSAKLLVEKGAEIIILPARGVPYEFAKIYKKLGGKKVYGVIPTKCPFYGKYTMKIIGDYLDVIDEKIEFDSWYDADGNIATLGDYTLCFGLSAGVLVEISSMKYALLYRGKKTKLLIFENTISKRLHKEAEESIKPIYISTIEELREQLR
jgi:hypothetical protein